LSDARVFTRTEGLQWTDPAGRTRTVTDLDEWTGARASAGRPVPRGFPKSGRFTAGPFYSP
jgi:topoisomerase-4 subunit A